MTFACLLVVVALLCVTSCCVAIACPGAQVRKAWRDLTCEEQQRYLNAVTTLKIKGAYNRFVSIHNINSATSHARNTFLPWHRWFIWQFEKQLQKVTGNCAITLPYWDWERDYLLRNQTSTLRANTFGSVNGIKATGNPGGATYTNCVIEGIANYNSKVVLSNGTTLQPWNFTVRSQLPLRRNLANFAFTSDLDVLNRILNNDNYVWFRPALEGGPHAGPHNFISGHMGTMHSPDDPLFFVHHANVDRLWAIWEDYYDVDKSDASAYTATHYNLTEIDVPLIFQSTSFLDVTVDGVNYPRPRDLLSNYNGLVNVTYANDYMAKLLIDVTASSIDVDYSSTNNLNWVKPATGPVATRCVDSPCLSSGIACSSPSSCCSGICTNGACSAATRRYLKTPDSPPKFANAKSQNRYMQLVNANPKSRKADIICQLAHEDCVVRGNPVTASPDWIQMLETGVDPSLFNCHQKCNNKMQLVTS